MARKINAQLTEENKEWFFEEIREAVNELLEQNQSGNGTPETNVTAKLGTTYKDLTNGVLYIKATETVAGTPDKTGWVVAGTQT